MSAFRWITKPTDEPLNVLGTIVVLVLTLNILIFLVPLRQEALFNTGTYGTDTHVQGVPFMIQLALLFAGVVALNIAPARWMKGIMIVQGSAMLLAYNGAGPFFAPVAFAALTAWFFVFRIPIPVRWRWIVPIAIIIGSGLFGATKLVKGPFAFSMFFTMRLMLYAWEQHQNEYPKNSLIDFWVYFLTAPLLFIYPYMLLIPQPGKYVQKLKPRLTERRGRRVIVHFAIGLVMVAGTYFAEYLPLGAIEDPVGSMVVNWVYSIIFVTRLGNIAFALLLLHGVDCRPATDGPALATDFAEMWNRFQIHQKDAQVVMFYNPALIRLRKRNRYLAITLAVFWTMFVGNFVIHIFARYIYTPGRFLPFVWSRGLFFLVGGAALAATLCLQEWRRRNKRTPPQGFFGGVYTYLCWVGTQLFTAWLMSLP